MRKKPVPKNPDILYLGVNAWDSILQRPQHLARGLSGSHRVLYADPTVFSVFTKGRRDLSRARDPRGWRPSLRRLSGSLFVFTPPPLFPLSLWSATANELNGRILARMLSRVFRELRFRPGLLWGSSPLGWPLVKRIRADRVCYDCLDNFPAFYRDRRGTLLKKQEARLLQRADVVFATDRRLADRCGFLCRSVHLVPNAVHPDFLNCERAPCPPALAGLPGPIVGYAGALSDWIDYGLIRELARARPDVSFVLIGPGSGGRGLRKIPNVLLLGEKPHHELPAWLDRFDACLIPFRDSELTRSVNPVKLYEYLARGKPVVATATPALASFADVCRLAGNRSEFLEELDRALQEQGETRERMARERVRFAGENTWQHRTDQVLRIVEDLFG
jgi:O-antigen biosynthesis protein